MGYMVLFGVQHINYIGSSKFGFSLELWGSLWGKSLPLNFFFCKVEVRRSVVTE